MKSSHFLKLTGSVLTVALLAVLVTACGQKKEDSVAGGRTTTSGNPTGPANIQGYKPLGAYVVATSPQGATVPLSQGVVDLLSANYAPDVIGAIDDQSVIIAPYLETAANGTLNLKPSSLKIWITDSFARDNVTQRFYIEMFNAVSGSFANNTVNAVFKDDNREVTINATISGAIASGTIGFRNLKDLGNGTPKSAQVLGYFVTETCGLINCRTQ